MPNGDQYNGKYHHADVFYRPIAGGGVGHGLFAKSYQRTNKIQAQTDEQLRVCRYHGEKVDQPVSFCIEFVAKPTY